MGVRIRELGGLRAPRFGIGGPDGGVSEAVQSYLHEQAQRDYDELCSRTGARYGIMERREP